MYLRILLTTTLSIGFVLNVFSQDHFPFTLETDNHSSYYGLVANTDNDLNVETTGNTRSEDIYEETSSDYTPLPISDNNGNLREERSAHIPSTSSKDVAAIKIIYADAGFTCYNDLEVTLGFETYTMTDSELNLSLPKGRYYYQIKGDLACASTDGCQINNTGIIDIDETGTLYLSWQVTDYQSCWMSLRSSNYYDKVID